MKIKNYTSTVSVSRSISLIEDLLRDAGATTISKFFDDDKRIAGFFFQLVINGIPHTFKLPSNPKAVEKVMLAEIKKARPGTKEKIIEQAERTSWKLLHEWVHIQVSMIMMEQAESIQVFLPYIYDQKTDKTLFEIMKANDFKQLAIKN